MTFEKKSEVKAWEAERTSCEHVLCLDQQPAMQLDLAHAAQCSSCTLTNNLWLCMVCGDLGCGRKQIGGQDGNGHAMQHFATYGHGVVCKLATITPEGDADMYCYHCDDERIDPELAAHMRTFGIDVLGREKTEKSLAEMELDHNLTFDFSLANQDGKPFTPLYGPGFTGMANLGNSCYMASVLQSSFALEPIRHFYRNTMLQHQTVCRDNHLACWTCQMGKLADGLLSGRYSIPSSNQEQIGIKPWQFKALIGKDHAEFSTMKQQDAFEFFQHFTKIMEHKENANPQGNPAHAFRFKQQHRLQCMSCKRVRYWDDYSTSIQVGLKPDASLQDLILQSAQPELLEGWSCPACHSTIGAIKTTRMASFPRVLVVNLRRFELVNWVPAKLATPVSLFRDAIELSGLHTSNHVKDQNEEMLPEESTVQEPQVNPDDLAQLEAMGFPASRCRRALLQTNNQGIEVAMNWLIEHMDDPEENTSPSNVSTDMVTMLCDMGFTAAQAKKALTETSGDMERAVEWLFSHPDETGEDTPPVQTEEPALDADATGNYQLRTVISHKGTSVHCGHYVAHAQLPSTHDPVWAFFNDSRVVEMTPMDVDDMIAQDCYVVFLERK